MTEFEAYFTPVCLYPHTAYRSAEGVRTLFEKYLSRAEKYLIIVADRLLALDKLVAGRFLSETGVFISARREAEQVRRLIMRIEKQFGVPHSGKVLLWDEIANTTEYREFASRLTPEVMNNDELAYYINSFVESRVERFGLGASPAKERAYELEYLLSEICMSVFCTEMLGYAREIWERPPPEGSPDPLRILYENHRELVPRVTGRPVRRVLEFVFEKS